MVFDIAVMLKLSAFALVIWFAGFVAGNVFGWFRRLLREILSTGD